jgi:hypothetical protein
MVSIISVILTMKDLLELLKYQIKHYASIWKYLLLVIYLFWGLTMENTKLDISRTWIDSCQLKCMMLKKAKLQQLSLIHKKDLLYQQPKMVYYMLIR